MSLRLQLKSIKKAKKKSPKITEADLINAESKLGRTLFGPIPEGHHREFFNHKRNVWIWHERWTEKGHQHSITIRYEVRPSGVFKRIGKGSYKQITGDELANFRRATHAYLKLVKQKLYN